MCSTNAQACQPAKSLKLPIHCSQMLLDVCLLLAGSSGARRGECGHHGRSCAHTLMQGVARTTKADELLGHSISLLPFHVHHDIITIAKGLQSLLAALEQGALNVSCVEHAGTSDETCWMQLS